MGAMSRTKGASAERELRRLLIDQLGDDVVGHRNLFQYQEKGQPDLRVGNAKCKYDIEVKRKANMKRAEVKEAWREAINQANGAKPVLAYRRDRDEWRFVLATLKHNPDYIYTAEYGLHAFCYIVRESL